MKKNQHVVPYTKNNGEKFWAVKSSGSQRVGSVHKTQSKAKQVAVLRAKSEKSEVLIHNSNGRIRERNSYGQDKFPPRG